MAGNGDFEPKQMLYRKSPNINGNVMRYNADLSSKEWCPKVSQVGLQVG
jgi:hypothetical protein